MVLYHCHLAEMLEGGFVKSNYYVLKAVSECAIIGIVVEPVFIPVNMPVHCVKIFGIMYLSCRLMQ